MLEKTFRDFMMIWTTVDPIGTLALFAGLTASLDRQERRRVARRATIYAAVILVVAVVIGQIVLDAMGIRLLSLQVAGGIILFIFGLQMLFGWADNEQASREPGRDLAVFPIAVPSIAGPGAIMAVILLTDNDVYTVPQQAQTAVVLLVVLALNYAPVGRGSARHRTPGSGDSDPRHGNRPRCAVRGARHESALDRQLGDAQVLETDPSRSLRSGSIASRIVSAK